MNNAVVDITETLFRMWPTSTNTDFMAINVLRTHFVYPKINRFVLPFTLSLCSCSFIGNFMFRFCSINSITPNASICADVSKKRSVCLDTSSNNVFYLLLLFRKECEKKITHSKLSFPASTRILKEKKKCLAINNSAKWIFMCCFLPTK